MTFPIIKDNSDFENNIECVRNTCSVCESPLDNPIIQLPKLPLTGIYTSDLQTHIPMEIDQIFSFCDHCLHGQTHNYVSLDYLYGQEYSFRTSLSETSRSGSNFFLNFLKQQTKDKNFDCIIDVGCNDLYLLELLEDKAQQLIGIDPIWNGKENTSNNKNIQLIGEMIKNVNLGEICANKPDLIVCRHTLEHIPNPKKMIKQLLDSGTEETTYVFEFPAIEPLLKEYRFDRIFHQHLQYFSLPSITQLLNELNADIIDYQYNEPHWGALLIAFKKSAGNISPNSVQANNDLLQSKNIKERYQTFQKIMQTCSTSIKSYNGQDIYGYGAGNMLPILYYHLGLSENELTTVYDDEPIKNNLKYVNLDVIIKTPQFDKTSENNTYVITALDHIETLENKLKSLGIKQIINPIEKLRL